MIQDKNNLNANVYYRKKKHQENRFGQKMIKTS